MEHFDVIIIGAGPAGTACASLLNHGGLRCLIIEKSTFPRFCIGESLLPQAMEFYDQCDFLDILSSNDFPKKTGASFLRGKQLESIEFKKKFSHGPSETFQVRRDEFDHLLCKKIQNEGVKVLFGHTIDEITIEDKVHVSTTNKCHFTSRFIVDASGLAKVLPRFLEIKTTSGQNQRQSFFSHIETKKKAAFDHNKILITVDELNFKNWFWTIPLSNCKYSLGIVTNDKNKHLTDEQIILSYINRNESFKETLDDFRFIFPVKSIKSFTSKTESLHGDKFLIIGNSGEFLDPVFSSGLTIALKSATLCAPLILQHFAGKDINWTNDYLNPLNYGIQTFRAFVNSWYTGDLQKIIFSKNIESKIHSYIISILAGYAWDRENPFTSKTDSRIKALANLLD